MKHHTITLYVLLFATALLTSRLSAQTQLDPMTAGRTYVIAYPDTTRNTFDTRFTTKRVADTIAVYIYSPVATKAKITGSGYTNNVTIQAGRFAEIYLNGQGNKAPSPILDDRNVVSDKVFRIEAEDPVIVYCYIGTNFACEAWTPLPVETWGREYVAAAMPGEVVKDLLAPAHFVYNTNNKAAPAEIIVLSAYDNTHVTITPTGASQFEGGPSLNVTLGANRAYQLQSIVDTATANLGMPQIDITGARIVADRPIGVMSGTTRTQVTPDSLGGLARNSLKNFSMETLAPVEQHGTEFVMTPVMDDRLVTKQPGELIGEKRRSNRVRIVASDSSGVRRYGDGSGSVFLGPLPARSFLDDTLREGETNHAHAYHTFGPAQGFLFPAPASKNLSASGGSESYDSWGSFMMTMTPREQWGTFAPFIAPIHPGGMKHYVNIVTDSNSRLKIQDENGSLVAGWRAIPGTDLVWAFRSVVPGITKYFKSTDTSARFSAYAYGLYKGHEEFRPANHSEYEEYLALSYGYPIAPRRAVLYSTDTFRTEGLQKCDSMGVSFILSNGTATPTGFKEITIDPDSSNVTVAFISPQQNEIAGSNVVRVLLRARNKLNNALANFRIVERSGKINTFTYTYVAPRLSVNPAAGFNFGEVRAGKAYEGTITITNPSTDDLPLRGLLMAGGGSFTIIDPSPVPPSLAPGASLPVRVRFTPTTENTHFADTLRVDLICAVVEVPVTGQTAENPCVYVGDLNFGTFVLGRDGARTVPLKICNQGRVEMGFEDIPGADSVASWLDKHFSAPRSTLDNLRNAVLGPEGSGTECFTLYVTYTPETVGSFSTVARFSTDVDCTRDTSVWSAQVEGVGGVAWSSVVSGTATICPVPAHERAELHLRLQQHAPVEIVLLDATGADVLRASRTFDAGEATVPLDVSGLSSGVYYCRITVLGAVQVLPLVVAR